MPKTQPFKNLLQQMAPERRAKIEAAVQQALLNPAMQQQNSPTTEDINHINASNLEK
jgi:hypothetical protein